MILLLPLMKKAPKTLIVNVSSSMHALAKIRLNNINLENGKYYPTKVYGQIKLALVLQTKELAQRLGKDSNVTCYGMNPGVIKTDLQSNINDIPTC